MKHIKVTGSHCNISALNASHSHAYAVAERAALQIASPVSIGLQIESVTTDAMDMQRRNVAEPSAIAHHNNELPHDEQSVGRPQPNEATKTTTSTSLPLGTASSGARWLKLDISGGRQRNGAATSLTGGVPARLNISTPDSSPSRAARFFVASRDTSTARDPIKETSRPGLKLRLGGDTLAAVSNQHVHSNIGTPTNAAKDSTPISRFRRNASLDRWDVGPKADSAAREGRHFSVSNVGNKGRIYMRYDDATG